MKHTLMLSASLILVSLTPVTAALAQTGDSMAATRTATGASAVAPTNEAEFRATLARPGHLSLLTSQVAVDKATNPQIKDFARFEVEEQKAIDSVFKDMKTPAPTLTDADRAILEKLKATPKGAEFDRAYMQAQLDTHKELQAITQGYLANSKSGSNDPMEKHGRHLATLALATINEHVAMSAKMAAAVN